MKQSTLPLEQVDAEKGKRNRNPTTLWNGDSLFLYGINRVPQPYHDVNKLYVCCKTDGTERLPARTRYSRPQLLTSLAVGDRCSKWLTSDDRAPSLSTDPFPGAIYQSFRDALSIPRVPCNSSHFFELFNSCTGNFIWQSP